MDDPLIDESLASLPETRQATIRALHELIVDAAPSLPPAMVPNGSKPMIGYCTGCALS